MKARALCCLALSLSQSLLQIQCKDATQNDTQRVASLVHRKTPLPMVVCCFCPLQNAVSRVLDCNLAEVTKETVVPGGRAEHSWCDQRGRSVVEIVYRVYDSGHSMFAAVWWHVRCRSCLCLMKFDDRGE